MTDKTYIYTVTDLDATPEPKHRLVRAKNSAQALRYVTGRRFVSDLATQEALVALTAAGVNVETVQQAESTDA